MFSLTIQAGYEGSDIATSVSDYAVFFCNDADFKVRMNHLAFYCLYLFLLGRLIFQYILLKTCKM